MNEKEFQDSIIGLFKERHGHAVNMEPHMTNPGIPDVNWCMAGIEGNLELKVGKDDGVRPRIRPTQLIWFRKRVAAGGYPMFGIYVNSKEYTDEVYIFQGRYLDKINEMKKMSDLLESDIPQLRIMDPNNFVEGLVSEMASWHDEIEPPN